MMTRNTYRVKEARRTPRPAAPFGAGILRSVPCYREPYTAEDAAWAAQAFADASAPTDAEIDRMAMEREWERRYEEMADAGERCRGCGLADDFLGADGLCPPCRLDWGRAVYGSAV